MIIAFKKDKFTHKSAIQMTWNLKQTVRRAEVDEGIKVYNSIDNYCADDPIQTEKDYWLAEVKDSGVTFIN